MSLSREGRATITIVLLVVAVLAVVAFWVRHWAVWIVFGAVLALALLIIYFFRDPVRTAPVDPNAIVSPADGQVLGISRGEENEFIHGPVMRIDIFLSVFDVHVNYVPLGGTVRFYRFRPGKFLRAFEPEASSANEHTLIGLETAFGKILFKQSVGIFARRVVCHLREGDRVVTGQKFGIMKFGSRMEVYLPAWATITINRGDRVRGGESVIAKVHENPKKK
jgi:phosphatidylserine decarboxylase